MKTADILDKAAQAIETVESCTAGIVLASGLSRLLDRLKASDPYHGIHDVEPDPEGLPTRVDPDPMKPKQLKIDRLVPFAIISAFRNQYSRKANLQRSAQLLRAINQELDRPGAYKLIGYWAEKDPSAVDLSYKEALQRRLVADPSKEESFLIVKPTEMAYEDFESSMLRLGRATDMGLAPRGDPRQEPKGEDEQDTQDSILICDGKAVYLANPRDLTKFQIGTGFAASVIAKAYSRMRDKPEVPFVFAGTQQPGDNGGRYLMVHLGLLFFSNVNREEYKASRSCASFWRGSGCFPVSICQKTFPTTCEYDAPSFLEIPLFCSVKVPLPLLLVRLE